MILKKITIHNYRSIEELAFDIDELDDGTYTYGLIGVNEAGKSTILKAIALKDGLKDEKGQTLPLTIDFKDKALPIVIEYLYLLNETEIEECKEQLKISFPDADFSNINISEVNLVISFNYANPDQQVSNIDLKKLEEENEEKNKFEVELKPLIIKKSHKTIFWTAEDRYLISQPINIEQFAVNPDEISIPLTNCFLLVGINKADIQAKITSIGSDPTEIEELQNDLGDIVTDHINKVWPKHPIKITFIISSGLLHFHVKDIGVKGRAKTTNQRSDGFRQFISFLLTISAQSEKNLLSNSILLLDEPETHLHPQAQENLLQELVKITHNQSNNVVFFATHSNYMIDKEDLSRNYKIIKREKTDTTSKEQFDKKISTYASVTYEVFGIDSTDYHNELYGYLEENEGDKLNNLKPKRIWYNLKSKKNEEVSLSKYIRNSIHHPENTQNKKFTSDELHKSIEKLRKMRYED